MKIFILLFTFVVISQGRKKIKEPEVTTEPIEILELEISEELDGSYHHSFESANGISISAKGELEKQKNGVKAQKVEGRSKYTAPNGKVISLSYKAGVQGYQPRGSHIPTTPPPPAHVRELLKYLATAPPYVEPKWQVIPPKPRGKPRPPPQVEPPPKTKAKSNTPSSRGGRGPGKYQPPVWTPEPKRPSPRGRPTPIPSRRKTSRRGATRNRHRRSQS